jgi:hypothetical protein
LLSISDWSIIMIRPGGLPLLVPPPICWLSQFQFFLVGVAKEYVTKLRCEKYFCRVAYWVPLEMLLIHTFAPKHAHEYTTNAHPSHYAIQTFDGSMCVCVCFLELKFFIKLQIGHSLKWKDFFLFFFYEIELGNFFCWKLPVKNFCSKTLP